MIQVPDKFIFMKVGDHAAEPWEKILERKRREFQRTGHIFWGYGGSACHPISQVQPFARIAVQEHGKVVLVMEQIDSRAEPDLLPATEFSRDGIKWEPIPDGISVVGSRYAFILDEIQPGDLDIELAKYEVAVGPSSGKPCEAYLSGHVDKGCFVKSTKPRATDATAGKLVRKARFFAKLKEPYAVLLRGKP
jgi:hypothetical protein